MNIESYISQLLYRYQCVTVPGFGAFLTEIKSAQWMESANSFFPPKKQVSFNAHLKNNDGLLANHIARTEKTSYEYAVSAIQYEVVKWKKSLEENGVVNLKNIGELSLNSESYIVFKPSDQTNYLTTSFGLTSFVSPVVKRTAQEENTIEKVEKEIITLDTEQRATPSYLKYAAVIALGLGITAAVGYPVYQNQIETQTVLVETAVQKKVNAKIQEATFFIKSPIPAVTLAVKENKMPYHIMAGAFREEANADKIYNRLSNLGYKAKRIAKNKHGLYPVLYGSYATFAEAEKAQKEIQKNDNPQAWILIESL
jgi:nucleoid DNA-binding protein/cell division septation protein DedD